MRVEMVAPASCDAYFTCASAAFRLRALGKWGDRDSIFEQFFSPSLLLADLLPFSLIRFLFSLYSWYI